MTPDEAHLDEGLTRFRFGVACVSLFLGLVSCRPELVIVAGGDIGLSRNTGMIVDREGPDALLRDLRPLLADTLSLANLEGVLSDRAHGPWAGPKDPNLVLSGSRPRAAALRSLTAVSIANNHSLDAGLEGWDDTQAALTAAGVMPLNGLTVLQRGSFQVAILAVSEPFPELFGRHGTGPVVLASLTGTTEEVRRARNLVATGLVIVMVHWGQENSPFVTDLQRTWGRAWIDAGADLVLGSHPHVWQEVERRGRGVIAYSLGNLAFDSGGTEVRDSGLLKVTWSQSQGVVSWERLPLWLEGPGRRPHPIDKTTDLEKDRVE